MGETAKRKASNDDLHGLPENMIGEIIDGEVIATPRPSARHGSAAFALSSELGPPFQFGRGGGPGGWIILFEPEVMLGEDLVVPDLAGWRKERLLEPPKENWVSVAPDWVCEILSPRTLRLDKTRKMPLYAQRQIPHLWLIDPIYRTLSSER